MNNSIKLDQKNHYQVAAKFIGQKKPTLSRDFANSDVRIFGNTISRTFAQQNNALTSSTLYQNSPGLQSPQKSFYQMKDSQNYSMSDSNSNTKHLRNSSLQNTQQNNASKQMHHRRLKQSEDLSNNYSQNKLTSSHSIQHLNKKDLYEKQITTAREQSSTPLSKQIKQPTSSVKSLHNFDLQLSQRQLHSTIALPSVKNMTQRQQNIFSRSSLKHINEHTTNFDSGFATKCTQNSELISSSALDSYQYLNDNFSKKFDWIDKIESKQFQSVTQLNPDQYFKMGAQKKVRKQNVNILDSKTINSQATQDGAINILRCEINEFLYFKIKILERKSPLRIKFLIENNQSHIKLYVSKTSFQPNNFNCDYIYNNAKVISIEEEKNQSIFRKHPFLYFALVSEQEQDIHIKYTFGYEERRNSNSDNNNNNNNGQYNKATITQITEEENVSQMNNNKLRLSVQESQSDKIQKMSDAESFIQKNIQVTSEIDQFTKNIAIYSKKRDTTNHLNNVIKKAAELKEAKQNAIEEEQQQKLLKQIEKIKRFRQDFFTYFWIQTIKLVKISSVINDLYKEKKEVIQSFAKIAWRAVPLTNKFRRFRSRYPKDLFLNNLRYAKVGLATFANIIKEKKEIQTGSILIEAFKQNQMYSELRKKINKYFSIVITNQEGKLQKIIIQALGQVKIKIIFQQTQIYYFMGMEQTIDFKKSDDSDQIDWKKKQSVLNQINVNEVKTHAIDEYFNDQMIDFRQKISNYLHMMRHIPKEQRNKIKIMQVFLNNEELNRKSEIFENYNENEAEELNVFYANMGNDQTHKASNAIKKPRLFVVPTFQSIKSVFKRGIIFYAQQNPSIMEKISFKEV